MKNGEYRAPGEGGKALSPNEDQRCHTPFLKWCFQLAVRELSRAQVEYPPQALRMIQGRLIEQAPEASP